MILSIEKIKEKIIYKSFKLNRIVFGITSLDKLEEKLVDFQNKKNNDLIEVANYLNKENYKVFLISITTPNRNSLMQNVEFGKIKEKTENLKTLKKMFKNIDILETSFYDIEIDESLDYTNRTIKPLQKDETSMILGFVNNAFNYLGNNIKPIFLVHCEYGVSRSFTIGLVIEHLYFQKIAKISKNKGFELKYNKEDIYFKEVELFRKLSFLNNGVKDENNFFSLNEHVFNMCLN
jgi:hypothetical protein